MVNLQTADNVLKTFYLDAVTEQLDSKVSPFFSMIEKTSAYVNGKGVAKVVRTGVKGGVGAGTETGALPTAKENQYLTLQSTLKNLYGTIEISDKAIRASANGEGAFVNLLNDEMQALIKSAKENFSRMLFGDGSGSLAEIVFCADDGELTVDRVEGLKPGMEVYIYYNGELEYGSFIVGSVDKENKIVILDGFEVSNAERMKGMCIVDVSTTWGCELTGLRSIFSDRPLYGVDRQHAVMRPYIERDMGGISESVLQKAIDEIEAQSGSKINLILCSRGVRRALIEHCREKQLVISTTAIGDDPAVMTFNGIPVVVDDYCPAGTMYLLNTNDFKLCQLCDWQWMEGESNKILKQIPGTPVYAATLVKYAELICERPNAQGMLTDIDEV